MVRKIVFVFTSQARVSSDKGNKKYNTETIKHIIITAFAAVYYTSGHLDLYTLD